MAYVQFLFLCTFALTHQYGESGPTRKNTRCGRSLGDSDFGDQDNQDGKISRCGRSVVDGSNFHRKHTDDRFPHESRIGAARPLAHKNLPAKDEWDGKLLARLRPLMKKHLQPYLMYLHSWRLNKGKPANSFNEEKRRFTDFVEYVNKRIENNIESALLQSDEARSQSGHRASDGSRLNKAHVHASHQKGQGSNFGHVQQRPTPAHGGAPFDSNRNVVEEQRVQQGSQEQGANSA